MGTRRGCVTRRAAAASAAQRRRNAVAAAARQPSADLAACRISRTRTPGPKASNINSQVGASRRWPNKRAPRSANSGHMLPRLSNPLQSGPKKSLATTTKTIARLATQTTTTTTTTTTATSTTATTTELGALCGQQLKTPRCVSNIMESMRWAPQTHSWQWHSDSKPNECILSSDNLEVCFHPDTSESAAATRGTKPLNRNGNSYFWELTVLDKAYGTSVMFGLCTEQQQLHWPEYCNLIGLDEHGWSLNHKGQAWHNGQWTQFSRMFPTNQPVKIGLLFNTMLGELSYFLDGVFIGVAFRGLNSVKEDLYPVVGSTAKCTRIRLDKSYYAVASLFERSCHILMRDTSDKDDLIEKLRSSRVPRQILNYLVE